MTSGAPSSSTLLQPCEGNFGKGPEKNSTILLPLPIDLFTPIGQRFWGAASQERAGGAEVEEEEARTLAEAKSPRAGEDDATGEGGRRRELEGSV